MFYKQNIIQIMKNMEFVYHVALDINELNLHQTN